jgi:8-oxo-dGTP diphosphatase/2-hydroxy-dATP diphosphatase
MKKRGFGAGRWNGFGGKVQEGETIETAAKREIKEEVNLEVNDIKSVGSIDFYFSTGSKNIHQVHIYVCNDYNGEIMETEEMKPKWFKINELPLENMWQADTLWFPVVLNNKKIKGEFLYDMPSTPEYISKVLENKLEEYD